MAKKTIVKKASLNMVSLINEFQNLNAKNHRFHSFDYCYHYFATNKGNLCGNNLERSCMTLWAFLGSWGMFRSGSLKWENPSVLKDVIEFVNDPSHHFLWDIDIDNYEKPCINTNFSTNLDALRDEYKSIEIALKNNGVLNPSHTLVTKIMLGIHSNVPAFDRFVCKTIKNLTQRRLGFKRNGSAFMAAQDIWRGQCNALSTKASLAEESQQQINKAFQTFNNIVVDDFNGQPTNLKYSNAKIFDMFAFEYGKLV